MNDRPGIDLTGLVRVVRHVAVPLTAPFALGDAGGDLAGDHVDPDVEG